MSTSETHAGETPHVCVIMACLNGAATLAEALRSLVAQQCHVPWEFVFADNGSVDGSQSIFEDYARQAPHIPMRLVNASDVRGKAYALNVGIRATAARWILFCDADDQLDPGYIAAMAAALADHPFVAARIDAVRLNPDGLHQVRDPGQCDGLRVLPHAPHCRYAGGATLGFDRAVFDSVGGFDTAVQVLEDTDFCIRASLAGFALQFVPEAVYYYRFKADAFDAYRQAYRYAMWRVFVQQRYDPQPPASRRRVWAAHVKPCLRVLRRNVLPAVLARHLALPERIRAARQIGATLGEFAGARRWRIADRAARRRPSEATDHRGHG